MRLIDSHNHLQDERLNSMRDAVMNECRAQGVIATVVNGSCPEDWSLVADLAKRYAHVIPCFGVHPWYISNLPVDWREALIRFLDEIPSAIGEVGIDGWKKEFNPELQERIFATQVHIAAERNLPLSIHGLRKWGRLFEILSRGPRPIDMIKPFTKLGAYFSCPGFFLQAGREMKLAVFKEVPRERLLLETDAPDQRLPDELDRYQICDSISGIRINHPANIRAVYLGVAALRGTSVDELAVQVESNFRVLFANVLARRKTLE
jgi:TatD DNase family protein